MVLKQEAQLYLLVKQLALVNNKSQVRNSCFKRAPHGQPICIKCNLPGHIA